MTTAIDVRALSKSYPRNGQQVLAVNNLNFSVPAGQVLAFLGPNGAGKTTTIKMMCGLITPSAGSVLLHGFDINKQGKEARTQISAVLEGTRNIYWRLSALENLLYFGRLRGFNGKGLKARAEALLRELELWDRRNDEPRHFSRGMQQKLAIASALITDPPIVLLDEPTLGLDVQAAKTVEEWVNKLAHERGKTVVITTHQLDMAQKIADRVVIINKGCIVADQPMHQLLSIFQKEFYEIRVDGHVEKSQLQCPEDFNVVFENGHTLITGSIPHPAMLYELLDRFRAMELPLMSVARTEPTLEDIFIDVCNV